MKVICNNAKNCKVEDCEHKEPHEPISCGNETCANYEAECPSTRIDVLCVAVEDLRQTKITDITEVK